MKIKISEAQSVCVVGCSWIGNLFSLQQLLNEVDNSNRERSLRGGK